MTIRADRLLRAEGNAITPEAQRAEPAVVVDLASEVWS